MNINVTITEFKDGYFGVAQEAGRRIFIPDSNQIKLAINLCIAEQLTINPYRNEVHSITIRYDKSNELFANYTTFKGYEDL